MNIDGFVRAAADLCLDSGRLLLRRAAERDVEVAIEHELDVDIMRWIRPPMTRAEVEGRVRGTLEPWRGDDGEWLILTVERQDGGEQIGIVACRITAAEFETVEIGFRLHGDYRGHGYAIEACERLLQFLFDQVQARKVVGFCVGENAPSRRLMAKLGMQQEGVLREFSLLAGAWRDEVAFGLLRREWVARRSGGTRSGAS